MFRKLQERVTAAATSAASAMGINTVTPELQQLVGMGFNEEQARNALQITNNDINQAMELLLLEQQQQVQNHESPSASSSSPAVRATATAPQQNGTNDNDDEAILRQVLEESYQFEQQKQQQQQRQQPTQGPTTRTAAMWKAAEAAEQRHKQATATKTKTTTTKKSVPLSSNKVTNDKITKPPATTTTNNTAINNNTNLAISLKRTTLATTHPDVKIIPKLQDKSKEEQILRCVDRMKCYPTAVDTLHRALTMVLKEPENPKYRTIDTTNPAYQRSVANVPGTSTLLQAMNYRPSMNNSTKLVLDIGMVDIALLYLGVSALEQCKIDPDYIEAKAIQQFVTDVQSMIHGADDSTEEAIARSKYMAQCPTEPNEGRGGGTFIQIKFATTTVATANHDRDIPTNALLTTAAATTTTTTTAGIPTPPTSGNAVTNNPGIPTVPIYRRRFDGDDTIQDIMNYIGSIGGTKMVTKIIDGEWQLRNLNTYPAQVIDCSTISVRNTTLQYHNCWPSGKLEIRPRSK